jgi:outer membrane cobalamin receptor
VRRSSTRFFEPALKSACIAALILNSGISAAQDDPVRLAPIVVTPTRIEQSSFDLPVSIDSTRTEFR